MDGHPLQILVLEDNPGDGRLVWEMLRWSERAEEFPAFDWQQCESLNTGLKKLRKGGFDLVILDLKLVDSEGIDTFLKIRSQAPEVPVVILTASQEQELGLKAVRAGAQDYVIKGQADRAMFVKTLKFSIERQRLITRLERQRDELERSNKRFITILEKDADGVLIVDMDGKIRYMNHAAEVMLGRKRSETLGDSVWFPVYENTATELALDHEDGTSILVELLTESIEWDGTSAHLVSMRDVSQRAAGLIREHA